MTATNIIFGRAAGMSFGYAGGLGHCMVMPVNMPVATILVFLFYPLFVFSRQRLRVIKVFKNLMDRTREAAEAHRDTIRKYGILGLITFAWLPFWLTGPLVGCVIGLMLGLRPLLNLDE
jgi:uncharacterized membrane protein